ncbi:hypothetical protein BQ8794_50752 [Mesorhizobium prunaredense]|uniref:Uncharacterized protein n=1 Tax=Mesorhizobium prunaredense TaxID=1631249 RepID=A0A1R3VFF9_9HYPH|nr:WD40 repeat domain-containing protein [Mesorhizobium prunaredense]SIT58650.1 hypothetical protein BQ8794_50752 [Mesorhizobium prunaredense]
MIHRPPHPYARRHLAAHAAAGGILDEVLNLETLPYLDQARLSSLLRLTEAEPNTLKWLLLSAWRSVRHRWSWDDLDANAVALDVAYLAAGGGETPHRPTTSRLTWKPLWVEWQSGGTIVASNARGPLRIAVGSPQGVPVLATLEGGRQIRLWDPATGQAIGEPLVAPDRVRTLVIASTPGYLVAACDGGRVIVWDAVTRLQVTTIDIPEPGPRALAVGELDGAWVFAAGGTSGVLHVRSLDSGHQVHMVQGHAPVRDAALATAADGRLYVAIGYGNGQIQVYDLTSGTPLAHEVSLGREINAVTLGRAEGRLLLAAGSADGTARVWDALSGRPVSEPFLHGDEVRSVALTTTGHSQLLATGSSDRTARVWYPHGSSPIGAPFPHPAPVENVAFAEVEGRMMLATGCLDGNTRLWDPVRPSAARVAVEGWLPSVGLDAGIVVAGVEGGSVRLWDRASGNPYHTFTVEPGDEQLYKTRRAPGVQVRLGSVEGRRTLTTLYRGRVAIWDLPDLHAPVLRGETTASQGHIVDVIGDRALVASADSSGTVHVVDLIDDAVMVHTHLRGATRLGLVPSPGRALLAVEGERGVHLLDAETGEPLYDPLPGTLPRHASVCHLDGAEVLAALDPGGLRLYDLRSGELTLPPLEMSNTANGIAWVRVGDRELLVTAHFATVRVWNPRTGRKVSEVPFGTEIAAMAVHEATDGAVTVAVSGPGMVLLRMSAATS